MMSGKTWAKDIATTNLIIATASDEISKIKNPSALKMLEAQLNSSLKDKEHTTKAAYCAYSIAYRKPFSKFNYLTAAITAFAMSGIEPSSKQLESLVNKLRSNSKVSEIIAILKG